MRARRRATASRCVVVTASVFTGSAMSPGGDDRVGHHLTAATATRNNPRWRCPTVDLDALRVRVRVAVGVVTAPGGEGGPDTVR